MASLQNRRYMGTKLAGEPPHEVWWALAWKYPQYSPTDVPFQNGVQIFFQGEDDDEPFPGPTPFVSLMNEWRMWKSQTEWKAARREVYEEHGLTLQVLTVALMDKEAGDSALWNAYIARRNSVRALSTFPAKPTNALESDLQNMQAAVP